MNSPSDIPVKADHNSDNGDAGELAFYVAVTAFTLSSKCTCDSPRVFRFRVDSWLYVGLARDAACCSWVVTLPNRDGGRCFCAAVGRIKSPSSVVGPTV